MGLPADVTIDRDTAPLRGGDLMTQINNLVDEVRTLRTGLAALAAAYNLTLAKLDADGGVTDTDFVATKAVVTTAFAADTTHKAAKLKH